MLLSSVVCAFAFVSTPPAALRHHNGVGALRSSSPLLASRATPAAVAMVAIPSEDTAAAAPESLSTPETSTALPKPTAVQDSLAGLTVAFSLLSKAIACSALVGINPLIGVWSSVVMGLSAPLLGARPGVISGAAAVVAVPLSIFTAANGLTLIPLVMLVAAILEWGFALLKLVPLASLVTPAVLAGFLNGLGMILFKSQVKVFTSAPALRPAAAMAALCFVIVNALPLLTTVLPASLVGLAVASIAGVALKLPLETLASTAPAGTFAGGLSALPKLVDLGGLASMATSLPALKLVLPTAVSIAIISLIEALLSARVVDDMMGEPLTAGCTLDAAADEVDAACEVSTKTVVAMSAGNAATALFGGFGGCGLVPQTVLNIKSGGGGPLSSAAYALAMAAFVIFFAPLVGQISLAALAGIMFCVAYDTVQWGETIKGLKAALKGQGVFSFAALAISSVICYKWDMVVGIVLGVLVEQAGKKLLPKADEPEAATEAA